jgi:hypothetical protein
MEGRGWCCDFDVGTWMERVGWSDLDGGTWMEGL